MSEKEEQQHIIIERLSAQSKRCYEEIMELKKKLRQLEEATELPKRVGWLRFHAATNDRLERLEDRFTPEGEDLTWKERVENDVHRALAMCREADNFRRGWLRCHGVITEQIKGIDERLHRIELCPRDHEARQDLSKLELKVSELETITDPEAEGAEVERSPAARLAEKALEHALKGVLEDHDSRLLDLQGNDKMHAINQRGFDRRIEQLASRVCEVEGGVRRFERGFSGDITGLADEISVLEGRVNELEAPGNPVDVPARSIEVVALGDRLGKLEATLPKYPGEAAVDRILERLGELEERDGDRGLSMEIKELQVGVRRFERGFAGELEEHERKLENLTKANNQLYERVNSLERLVDEGHRTMRQLYPPARRRGVTPGATPAIDAPPGEPGGKPVYRSQKEVDEDPRYREPEVRCGACGEAIRRNVNGVYADPSGRTICHSAPGANVDHQPQKEPGDQEQGSE